MKTTNSERIYALDALRAIMMLLGIVLHAGITYASFDYTAFWPVKDPDNHIGFDIMVSIIHFFRMPVFFVVSGYFAALLFYKKGPQKMIMNRIKRILLPLIASVITVYPMAVFAYAYTKAAFGGALFPLIMAWNEILSGQFLYFQLLHLWFLYFLIFYAVGGWLIARIFDKDTALTTTANKVFTFILQNFWLRILGFTFLFFLCLLWIGEPSLTTNNKWSIDPPIFMTYFLFFLTGWVIFKTNSLDKLKAYPIWQLSLSIILFFAFILIPWPDSQTGLHVREFLSALFGTLFIFGFIALFMSYFNKYSSKLSYMMDAAYWVYIIHLPIVAFIPGLMAGLAMPVFLKFLITLSFTTTICFVSYHLLVRNTFIGMFLNGKMQKKMTIPQVNQAFTET
ncbi:MAG: acyltransferase family protein [Bacteroidales bacterium]